MSNHVLNSDHLLVRLQLIALLTRHHRKKLPKFDDASFNELGEEVSYSICLVIIVHLVLREFDIDLSCFIPGNAEIQSSLCNFTFICCVTSEWIHKLQRNGFLTFS